MKLAIVALVLAVSLFGTADAWYYGGWGYYPYYSWGYPYFGGWYGKRGDTDHVKQEVLPTTMEPRTECSYSKDTSMLACHGKSLKQECEAELNFPKSINYELYGIESVEEGSKFHLIPREMDNSAWRKDSIVEVPSGLEKLFTLTDAKKMGEDYGISVKDSECYVKISELLKMSTRNEKIYLESDLVERKGDAKKWETARIIAELVIFELSPSISEDTKNGKSKRWWGGMGGFGMMGGLWGVPMIPVIPVIPVIPIITPMLWGKRDAPTEMPKVKKNMDMGMDMDMDLAMDMDMGMDMNMVKRALESGFEATDKNTHSLAMEIQRLTREVKILKMNAINEHESLTDTRDAWSAKEINM